MHRFIDVAAAHWVLMRVLELLQHHLVAQDLLGVAAFLPELMSLINFVPQLVKPELLQQSLATGRFQIVENYARGERFESPDLLRQVWALGDPMQVVLHDDESKDLDSALALQEAPGVEDDFDIARLREDGQPGHDGRCHEVGILSFENTITAMRHRTGSCKHREAEPRKPVRAQAEPGHEKRVRPI